MVRTAKSHITRSAVGQLNRNHRLLLQQVIDQERDLYNASLLALEYAHLNGADRSLDDLAKELTKVRQDQPEYAQVHRLLSKATLKRAAVAWNAHVNPEPDLPPCGKPGIKTPERFRTIAIESSPHPIIHFPKLNSKRPYLSIEGLPNIQLKSHQAIPPDRQPSKASITLKPDQIAVRLTYQEPPYPKKAPVEALKNPYGADSGVVCTVATSTGIAYTSPNEARLNSRIKQAQQQLERKKKAAVRLGLAGYQAKLDSYNHQVISDQGKPRFLLVWKEGQPTAAYAKALHTLQKLYQKRNTLRHNFRHRATSALVEDAVAQDSDLLVSEDLRIANMTRSARGTVANPGRKGNAKAGLNKVILRRGWGYIQNMLDYKAAKAGIRHIRVHPAGTSQTCNRCGVRKPQSRRSQAESRCTGCGCPANADHNAAINIADRGRYYLQKHYSGVTLQDIRLARQDGLTAPAAGRKTVPAARRAHPAWTAGDSALSPPGPESSEPQAQRSFAISSRESLSAGA